MFRPREEAAESHITAEVAAAFETSPGGDPQAPPAPEGAPWFQAFKGALLRGLRWAPHECTDLPAAVIFCAAGGGATGDPDPLRALEELAASCTRGTDLPEALRVAMGQQGGCLCHYVVLNDRAGGGAVSNGAVATLRERFGQGALHLLTVDSSLTPDALPGRARMLRAFKDGGGGEEPPRASGGESGEAAAAAPPGSPRLSAADAKAVEEMVRFFAVKRFIPFLEQRVRGLNAQISASRKGFKNQMKNYFFRKERDGREVSTGGAPGGGGLYPPGSVEHSIRWLADLAFALTDYNLALSSYKLLASDCKTDRAWAHHAGAMEKAGLAAAMVGASRREVEHCFETAYSSYSQSMTTMPYASRAAILLAEYQVSQGSFKDAAGSFKAAAVDKNNHMRGAIVLERSAECFALANSKRKFGFTIVLAGRRYAQGGLSDLATQAYKRAECVYEGLGWVFIEEHVHASLATQARTSGKLADAVFHFSKLLGAHQNVESQERYLGELLHSVKQLKQSGGAMEPLNLPLPKVSTEEVQVHFEDHLCYSAGARTQASEVWEALESRVTPPHAATSSSSTWLDLASSKHNSEEQCNFCVAGEEIGVNVEFSNILQIPIEVSKVQLMCEFTHPDGRQEATVVDMSVPATPESATPAADLLSGDFHAPPAGSSGVSWANIPESQFSLNAMESTKVMLKVYPQLEGTLRINGVAFLLCGVAHGHTKFSVKKPVQLGKKRSQECSPQRILLFKVTPPMPRLTVDIVGLPDIMYANEVCKCSIELTNAGSSALEGIRMCSSGDVVHCAQTLGERCVAPSPPLVGAGSEERSVERSQEKVYSFEGGWRLAPGARAQWPAWIYARGESRSHRTVHIAFYFEPEVPHDKMKSRMLCVSRDVQILPSLEASLTISTSENSLQASLAQLVVRNSSSTDSFVLENLACLEKTWSLQSLAQGSGPDDGTLSPGGSASMFYKLHPSTAPSGGGEEGPVTDAVRAFSEQPKPPRSGDPNQVPSRSVLFWRTVGGLDGMSHSGFQPLEAAVASSLSPVRIVVEVESCVEHDFSARPVCVVPVTVLVRSITLQAARCFLEVGPDGARGRDAWESAEAAPTGKGPAEGGIKTLRQSARYSWCGRTLSSTRSVAPGDTIREELGVAVVGPGMLEVGGVCLKWVQDGGGFPVSHEVECPAVLIDVRDRAA
jgi:tetratricopeptide (TPR) repeat protein